VRGRRRLRTSHRKKHTTRRVTTKPLVGSFVSLFFMGPDAGLPEGAVGADEGGTPIATEPKGSVPSGFMGSIQRPVLRLTAVGAAALAFWLPYTLRAGFVYDDWLPPRGRSFTSRW